MAPPKPHKVDIGEYKYGFQRRREAGLQDARGPRRGRRARDLGAQGRAAVDARLPPQGVRDLPPQADARRGAATSPASTSRTIFYYLKPSEENARTLGRRPRGHQEHVRAPGHPRGRAQVPRRRRRPVRVRGHLPQPPEGPRGQGRHLPATPTRRSRQHEELFREHWATVIPPNDNKFAALNSAVWSGGSFIYVPQGVKVELPLQAYFRINAQNMGQFERTLIIVDEGAYVHYVEGCTAPTYSSDSLHSAVVEIIVKQGRPLPLHDHPELVEQRLQPRHEARRRLRGRDDGVGRRQPRLEADDEVPGGHPQGPSARTARCSRSRSPARASTRTPAPRSRTWRPTRPR